MSYDEIGVRIFAGASSLSFAEKMCKYLGTNLYFERGNQNQ